MDGAEILPILRQVNQNLRSALVRFRPERTKPSEISRQDFSALRLEIVRAKKCLQIPPEKESANEINRELQIFRTNLEQLSLTLPDLQARLISEKARLGDARAHAAAAACWAKASEVNY